MRLPPEILKKVKLLELNTRRLVNNLFAGEYRTAFKGQGMTFSEFREYVPGDDVRAISWPVTARTGKTHIKKFDEERELTLMLAVDVSGSTSFGTSEYLKGEVLTHLAALLSFSAARNKDYVGLLLFSNQVEHFVPPQKGHTHVHRLLRDLLYHKPKSRTTRIASGLEYLQGYLKKRSIIFVLSDFLDEGYGVQLRNLANRHDVVAVVVEDRAEVEVPNVGLINFEDAETGAIHVVDTSSNSFRYSFAEAVKKRRLARERELMRAKVDRIDVSCDSDYVAPLVNFFKRRWRR